MPNKIANAIGTQQQFSKQPVATYVKQLRGVNATSGIADNGAGKRLYEALVGAGNSLMDYGVSSEMRKQADADKVESIINSNTAKDWETVRAVDMLQRAGKMQLADNPYAVAAIEKARGKYFADKFNQQYALMKAENPVKTVEEEATRYERERHNFYDDAVSASLNEESFRKGFYESYVSDVDEQANAKVAEQSKSLMAIRDGSFIASAEQCIEANKDKPPAEMAAAITTLMKSPMLTGMQDDKRKGAMMGILKTVAQQTGSTDMLDALKDVPLWTDYDTGEFVTAKDVIGFDAYYEIANQSLRAQPNEWYRQKQIEMLKCDNLEKLRDWYANLTPSERKKLDKDYTDRVLYLTSREQEEAQRKVAFNQKQIEKTANAQQAEISLIRHLNGQTAERVPVQEAYEASMADLKQYWQEHGDDKAACTEHLGKVLSWDCNTELRSELRNRYTVALDNLSAGDMQANDMYSVSTARSLWYANPARFETVFGDKLADKMKTLQCLVDVMGNEEAGYQLYVNGRDAGGKDNLSDTNKQLVDALPNETYSIIDIDASHNDSGTLNTGEVSFNDPVIQQAYQTAFAYLLASGKPADVALEMVKESLYNNYVVFDGRVFPKVICSYRDDNGNNGVWGADTYGAVSAYMRHKIQQAQIEGKGTWYWIYRGGKMCFENMYGNGQETPKDLQTFWDKVNEYGESTYVPADKADTSDNGEAQTDAKVTQVANGRATYGGPEWEGW